MTIPTIHVFLLRFIVPAYDWLPGTVLNVFLLCVLFLFAAIALDGRMLCELFFSALSLDLVFVVSQRLWWLVGVWSCGSWISIWFTSVTIRLSNRFCKFTGEGFLWWQWTRGWYVYIILGFGFHCFPFIGSCVICDQHFYYRLLIFNFVFKALVFLFKHSNSFI